LVKNKKTPGVNQAPFEQSGQGKSHVSYLALWQWNDLNAGNSCGECLQVAPRLEVRAVLESDFGKGA
jgi:hypothetical protein